MTTAIRTAILIGVTALVVVAAVGPRWVYAQTPAQMEYERQAREARQAEERRQQEQQRLQQLQNENARRQQEESSRFMRATTPGSQSPQSTPGSSPSRSAGAGAAQPAAPDICRAKPVRAGERNPLLGRWRYVETQPTAGQNPLAQLLTGICLIYADGLEFRERSMLFGGQVRPADYGRDGDVWMVCAGGAPASFRFGGSNRLKMVHPTCVFDRVGASPSATGPAADSAAGSQPQSSSRRR